MTYRSEKNWIRMHAMTSIRMQSIISGRYVTILLIGLVLLGLYLSSLYSYLLFHSPVELFSIVVAVGVFLTRQT